MISLIYLVNYKSDLRTELMEMEIGTATTGVRSGIGLGHLIIYGVSLGFLAWFCVILSRRF